MSRPNRVRHRCPVCGRNEWLARRPGGQAWTLPHQTPDWGGWCVDEVLVPVTDSDISSGKSLTR